MGMYPLVMTHIANWKDPPVYSWVNPLFPLGHVNKFAFCKRLPSGNMGIFFPSNGEIFSTHWDYMDNCHGSHECFPFAELRCFPITEAT